MSSKAACRASTKAGAGSSHSGLRSSLGPALPPRWSLRFNGEQEAEAGGSHPQFFQAEPGRGAAQPALLKTPLSQVVWGPLAWLPILGPGIGTGTDRQTHVCARVMATCRPVGTHMLEAQLWTGSHRAPFCRARQGQEGQGLGKPRMGPREGFRQERAFAVGFGG